MEAVQDTRICPDCEADLPTTAFYMDGNDHYCKDCRKARNAISNAAMTPTYHSWRNAVQRCTNPKASGYQYYGAIGVTVCRRWRNYANFAADLGERPESTVLGRYMDLGNYSCGVCDDCLAHEWIRNATWMTQAEQNAEQAKKRALLKAENHTYKLED